MQEDTTRLLLLYGYWGITQLYIHQSSFWCFSPFLDKLWLPRPRTYRVQESLPDHPVHHQLQRRPHQDVSRMGVEESWHSRDEHSRKYRCKYHQIPSPGYDQGASKLLDTIYWSSDSATANISIIMDYPRTRTSLWVAYTALPNLSVAQIVRPVDSYFDLTFK